MQRKIAVLAVMLALIATLVSAGLASSRATSYGAMLKVWAPHAIVAGQATGYSIMVVNNTGPTWKNVVLKAYLPHQTLIRSRTTLNTSPILRWRMKLSGKTAIWSLPQMTQQATVNIAVLVTVDPKLTAKLCQNSLTLTIGGKLALKKLIRCIPVRQS